ncbi:bifunctional response regulator/alkaline phosphatase family protein [candidate division WOR-3 bacterium]|nr:bifunctional response regulator/alkaline phosphatase family protein [candidate division WOR-3 bacterium]
MKLLWIDDEIDLLRPFVYALKEKGYAVETATNGPDGLALVKAHDFDLVLLDQMMAGMQGLEVLRAIKEADANVLVAMVTKSDEEALINEAYGKLVDDFVIKPFTPAQLLAVLKRLLEKKRLVAGRIAQEYTATLGRQRDTGTWQGWVDYYRSLSQWQGLLGRYGDAGLAEVQADRRREANGEFARFVEDEYRSWVAGRGPVMSHQVMERFVQPLWGEKPTFLLLLDSMRVDQWEAIVPLLRDLFEVETSYYCSILPTATPYSRNAIFSGLLPLDILRRYPKYWVFEDSGQNRFEEQLLAEQLKRLRFSGRSTFLKVSHGDELAGARPALMDGNVRFTALVLNFLDLLIHSIRTTRLLDEMIPDDAALVGTTRVWFASSPLYDLLRALARRDCRVVVTSDHGFVRVRRPTIIHGSREISANLRYKHGGAIRVEERDALLIHRPEEYSLPAEHGTVKYALARSDYYFIYPTKPREYEKTYKYTFQHGGLSLEEMVVPLSVLKPR